jgi:hypothetical protein
MAQLTIDKITEIYFIADDFCNEAFGNVSGTMNDER